jgi:hypothetical protein
MEALTENEYRPSILIDQITMSFPFRHRFYPRIVAETNSTKAEE